MRVSPSSGYSPASHARRRAHVWLSGGNGAFMDPRWLLCMGRMPPFAACELLEVLPARAGEYACAR